MKRQRMGWGRLCVLSVGAVMLASCGGGGGDVVPPPVQPLIPETPAIGAVLYQDARLLHPLRAGATYRYRGTDRLTPLHLPVPYLNSVQQSAGSGDEIVETSSNWFGQGADATPFSHRGDSVRLRQWVNFGFGPPLEIEAVEMRSPVRQSDQIVVLDRVFEDALADVDGDGKPEAIEVGAYRRIFGNETVNLRYLGSRVSLRVDFVTRVRARFSTDGSRSSAVEIVHRAWYAPGVGVVRQRLEVPTTSEDPQVYEEELIAWDGLVEGLGFTAPEQARVPMSSPVAAGGSLPRAYAFARHSDGAVVLTAPPYGSGLDGMMLSQIDARGRVAGNRFFEGWHAGNQQARLVSLGDELVALQLSATGPGYRLARFDASLNAVPDAQGVPIDLGPTDPDLGSSGVLAVAGDGPILWVLYSRYRAAAQGGGSALVLQAFDSKASPIGPAHVLESTIETWTFAEGTLSASAGRVAAGWLQARGVGLVDWRHAVLAPGGVVAAVGTLSEHASSFEGQGRVIVAGTSASWLWTGSMDTRTPIRDPAKLRGVTLGDDGTVQRTVGGLIDEEVLGSNWPEGSGWGGFDVDADARRAVVPGGVSDAAWPLDTRPTSMLQFAIVPNGPEPLPQRAAAATLWRVPPELVASDWRREKLVLLEDRVLLLGWNGEGLAPAIYWLP